MESVIAVIVCYQPDLEQLSKLLKALGRQTAQVVIVDNNSKEDVRNWLLGQHLPNTHCLSLSENVGVAKAQNRGISWAQEQGAKHVILFDQDSGPASDMVAELLKAAGSLAIQGYAVASVGPRYLDYRQKNPPPFIRINRFRLERCPCTTPNSIVAVDYLIASGCLIPMATLDVVGGMSEELFIDYVDIEWGLRAKYHGFQSFGVCSAHMEHSLGENPISFFGRKIPLHSPLRHYYHFRNALWCYKQSWLPNNWKIVDGWRLFLKYGFYTLFAEPRLEHFFMMTLGVWHGLIGRMGKFNESTK